MQIFNTYYNPDEGSLHPLWLGILILFFIIIILSILCCLRIKCGLLWNNLSHRSFKKKNDKHENHSSDDKHATSSHSYNWSPMFTPLDNESPKFHPFIRNIHIDNFDKQSSIKQQHNDEDKRKNELYSTNESDHHHHQISILPSIYNTRNSEIARKFYASMRNSSQHLNSQSCNSYHSDSSLSSNYQSSISIHSNQLEREANINLLRTPCFLHSIPYTDGLAISL